MMDMISHRAPIMTILLILSKKRSYGAYDEPI